MEVINLERERKLIPKSLLVTFGNAATVCTKEPTSIVQSTTKGTYDKLKAVCLYAFCIVHQCPPPPPFGYYPPVP